MSTVEKASRLEERTPLEWRDLLRDRLAAQAKKVNGYAAYYEGEHPLQFATNKFKEAFGNQFAAFADNWCEIVVDASVERLRVDGFRDADAADEDAWAIWQANALDVESVVAHTEAGKCGHCYLLVDPNDGEPKITVEHAAQMICAVDPGNRRHVLAALKEWEAEDERLNVTLYLPDVVMKWESSEPVSAGAEVQWEERDGGERPFELDTVPVVPLLNKPGLLVGGQSDLKPAIPIQNAVNKLCTDMLVSSEYGAFRQRVVTGVDVRRDPETGKPLKSEALEAAMSRYWAFEDKDVSVTDLAQTDLTNFVKSVEMFILHLAAQTRTPPHYLLSGITNVSGDALKAAEAGLVSKCDGKILYFSDAWEEAMALALRSTGRDVEHSKLEAVWASPERFTLGVLVDATVKKQALGVPREVLWLELGYTPQQIAAMKEMEPPPQDAVKPPPAEGDTPPAETPPPDTTTTGGD